MDRVIDYQGKTLKFSATPAAELQLSQIGTALLLEMELYFSCLVRKRVYVREADGDMDVIPVSDKLQLRFRPVVTQTCAMRDIDISNPPVKDMPMDEPERFFPHWLTLDFRRGKWQAEFGYASAPA